jgi:hypothetical protein
MGPSHWDGWYGPVVVTDLSRAHWRKSTASMGTGNCLEVTFLENGEVAIRDSKHQAGPVLEPQPAEWQAFIAGVKVGEFDIPR